MRPVQKKARVILACVIMFGWLLNMIMLSAIFPAIREFAKSVTPDILTGAAGGGPAFYIARIWLLVILAPLAESCFFAAGSGKRFAGPVTERCLSYACP